MAVRNFWVEADIDGRQTQLAGGPRAKNGEMEVDIYQRNDGSIDHALQITCREVNGELVLDVWHHGAHIYTYTTNR